MSENERNHADQAETLRRKVEEQTENHAESSDNMHQPAKGEEPELTPVGTGFLPPRSTVHKKPPPLNLTPYYIVGALVLLLLGGLGFWWAAAQSESAAVLPQPKAGETTKEEAASKPDKPAPKPDKPAPVPPTAKPSTTQTKPQAQAGTAPAAPKAPAVPPASKPTAPAAVKQPAAAPVQEKPAQVAKAAPSHQKRVLRHRVQKGDTLYKISVMYYGTGKYQFYLARYNGIRQLNAGTVLKVPIPPR
ncbi:LysM peptidoglycan-binding domain-containing protein [Aneurinibacillus sp. BA2021]|nr:LysM peptidoglycan-binding domain-containing protein [Aneurinibacillus sp. BA2021]